MQPQPCTLPCLMCAPLQEWNEKEKQKAHESFAGDAADQEGADGEDDDLPFACFICRRPWEEVSK